MAAASKKLQSSGYSIAALRHLAHRVLPGSIFDFADGGAEAECTLHRNEEAFREITLLPRPLRGTVARDPTTTLFGSQLSLPLVIGPVGLAGLFWPDGECAAARAASTAGIAYCLSHGSVCNLEALVGTGARPRWMQVFIYTDRGFSRELVQRAAAAGYDALVLTIDNQLLGNRERDLRNGFSIPPRFTLSALQGMAFKLPWLWRMRRELPRITFGNYVKPGEEASVATLASRMAGLLDPAMSWQDVAWLRELWPGTLLLKGVLHPAEAKEAVARGVDGVIVSNHGGRQLDGAPASVEALPEVIAAVDGRIPVLIDGGIRRGADVVKAIALGASAVLIGRPHLWGLAVAGEAGVAHVIELFRREIDRVMGLMGLSCLADLGVEDIRFGVQRGGREPAARRWAAGG